MSKLVFIYGTLKRNGSHNHLMRGAKYVSEAMTKPRYRLYSCGWYPAMVEDADGICIEGELWRVPGDTLVQLDEFEGIAGGEYGLVEIAIHEPALCESVGGYLYLRSVESLIECGKSWP